MKTSTRKRLGMLQFPVLITVRWLQHQQRHDCGGHYLGRIGNLQETVELDKKKSGS
jgi:hypothetical protein